jgi:hypothetical protein
MKYPRARARARQGGLGWRSQAPQGCAYYNAQ